MDEILEILEKDGRVTPEEIAKMLKKKAQDRRVLFGDSWEACMEMARKLSNFFGTESELDETVSFLTIWLNNQTLEDLIAKKELGIPEEILWSEAGYSAEQIVNMKKTPEYRATIAGWESSIRKSQQPLVGTLTDISTDETETNLNTDVKPVANGEKPKGTTLP